jgi:hypothetical protein
VRDALAQAALLQSPLLLCALTVVIAGAGSALPFSPIEPLLLDYLIAVSIGRALRFGALVLIPHLAPGTR